MVDVQSPHLLCRGEQRLLRLVKFPTRDGGDRCGGVLAGWGAVSRFERPARAVGFWVQQIGAFVVLLVLGHYLIGGAIGLKRLTLRDDPALDARVHAPASDELEDKNAYWREFVRAWDGEFEPYTHWRRKAFAGGYINIDEDGIRFTPKQPSPGAKKVFVFGGSTTWGTGVADADTIPALLQKRLGRGYNVTNYGESSYVAAQELNVLLELLARGERPDIVIFYDGVNDGYAGAYSPAVPRDPESIRVEFNQMRAAQDWSGIRALYEKSNYVRLVRATQGGPGRSASSKSWDAAVSPKIRANAADTVILYEAHIRQVKALAAEYGFKAYFFWQPNLFAGNRAHSDDYEVKIVRESSPVLIESQKAVYDAAKGRLFGREAEGIYFLADAFDAVEAPLYYDWHHVGARGNAIIAENMSRALTTPRKAGVPLLLSVSPEPAKARVNAH